METSGFVELVAGCVTPGWTVGVETTGLLGIIRWHETRAKVSNTINNFFHFIEILSFYKVEILSNCKYKNIFRKALKKNHRKKQVTIKCWTSASGTSIRSRTRVCCQKCHQPTLTILPSNLYPSSGTTVQIIRWVSISCFSYYPMGKFLARYPTGRLRTQQTGENRKTPVLLRYTTRGFALKRPARTKGYNSLKIINF
mgnify:CR=1 FL=1